MIVIKWLQLFRAQTAIATVYAITIPYLLSGGDPLILLTLVPLGILLHFFMFGHNSVMDYWYDIHDPNKAHHPLSTGSISLFKAHQVVHYGLVISALLLVLITLLISQNQTLALVSLLFCAVWGHAYNDGLDKNTKHSWLSISLCFSSLVMYGWFLGNEEANFTAILVFVWAFLTIFYQIAWEGNLKDLWNPAEKMNLLSSIGVKLESIGNLWKIHVPKPINFFMISVRLIANTVILFLLIVVLGLNFVAAIPAITIFTLFSIVEFRSVIRMHRLISKPFKRDDLLEYFGKAEAFEFFRLITVYMMFGMAQFVIGAALIILGIVWFIGMNKILWRSKFGPKV